MGLTSAVSDPGAIIGVHVPENIEDFALGEIPELDQDLTEESMSFALDLKTSLHGQRFIKLSRRHESHFEGDFAEESRLIGGFFAPTLLALSHAPPISLCQTNQAKLSQLTVDNRPLAPQRSGIGPCSDADDHRSHRHWTIC